MFDRLVLADTGLTFTPEGRQAFHIMADRVGHGGMEAIVDIEFFSSSMKRPVSLD